MKFAANRLLFLHPFSEDDGTGVISCQMESKLAHQFVSAGFPINIIAVILCLASSTIWIDVAMLCGAHAAIEAGLLWNDGQQAAGLNRLTQTVVYVAILLILQQQVS